MARIASVVIPSDKQVWIALTYVYGMGRTTSKKILAEAKIEPTTRVKDLTEADEQKSTILFRRNTTLRVISDA